MREIKLKECPFCKGKAKQTYFGKMKYKVYSTFCLNCTVSTAWYPTKREAKIMWNMRGGR